MYKQNYLLTKHIEGSALNWIGFHRNKADELENKDTELYCQMITVLTIMNDSYDLNCVFSVGNEKRARMSKISPYTYDYLNRVKLF